MMLLFAPTVNSYRHFAPGTFAPLALTCEIENRTTCFRVVGHDAGSLRVENRLSGSDATPYLIVVASLAAGKRRTKPLCIWSHTLNCAVSLSWGRIHATGLLMTARHNYLLQA